MYKEWFGKILICCSAAKSILVSLRNQAYSGRGQTETLDTIKYRWIFYINRGQSRELPFGPKTCDAPISSAGAPDATQSKVRSDFPSSIGLREFGCVTHSSPAMTRHVKRRRPAPWWERKRRWLSLRKGQILGIRCGPTDGPTDTPSYRDATAHVKMVLMEWNQ